METSGGLVEFPTHGNLYTWLVVGGVTSFLVLAVIIELVRQSRVRRGYVANAWRTVKAVADIRRPRATMIACLSIRLTC